MGKPLTEMTKEELFALFPIVLVPHNELWEGFYRDMAKRIEGVLPCPPLRICHIGSTAVPNIYAKNIVDILIEFSSEEALGEAQAALSSLGFLTMSQSEKRICMNCGYTENGFSDRVYHCHLRVFPDHDELYFRDYLREEPDTAKAYETLKFSLEEPFRHDRDGYTEAKGAFIREVTKSGKDRFFPRYEKGKDI